MVSGALALILSAVWSSADVPAVGSTRELDSPQQPPAAQLAAPPKPAIRERSEWDSRPPAAPPIDRAQRSRIIVHHTADALELSVLKLAPGSPESVAAAKEQLMQIRRVHRNTMGWRDIAYHYVVDWEGRAWAARPVSSLGAHTENNNSGSIGVAVMGNFELKSRNEAEEAARQRQAQGLEELLAWLAWQHRVRADRILGHHEYNATACPGKHLSRRVSDDFAAQRRGEASSPLREMRLRIVARLGGPAAPPQPERALAQAPQAPTSVAVGKLAQASGFDAAGLSRLYENGGSFKTAIAPGPLAEARGPYRSIEAPPLPPSRPSVDQQASLDPKAMDDGRFMVPFASQQWPPVRKGGRYGAHRHYGGHSGIDFALPEGTPIYASRPGRVVFVDKRYTRTYMKTAAGKRGPGNRVIIEHPDGTETEYAHLSPGTVNVKVGDVVGRDRPIGQVGNTGYSTGAHLHFEVLDARGNHRDPSKAIRDSSTVLVAHRPRRSR